MEYLNPISKKQNIIKHPEGIKKNPKKTIRKQRSDKTHNIKFPVSDIEKMKLQSLCRQTKRILLKQGKEPIQQTKLNTLLLVYGLRNQHILSWDWSYKDTKQYMHTNILESIYELEIGSPYALSVQKGYSDRKLVYMVIMSVIKWLEGEGTIEKIL
ncbi:MULTISPECIES: hypothetical protein [Bacillati]|uniref:hypothetical protein n=1 Tax=Bacillati TaxID=1783272 RepID=UPI0035DA8E27